MGAKRWPRKSTQALFNGVGAYGLKWFRDRTDSPHDYPNAPEVRSKDAVYAKLRREYGNGGLTRGARTLHEFANYTGYNRRQLLRARDALKQKWKRLCMGGDHIITDEQIDEIVEWLKHDYWSKQARLYGCLRCQTDTRPAYGLGLCRRCYFRYRRKCLALPVPTDPVDQRKLLRNRDQSGQLLENILKRFKRGHALDDSQLEWLYLVAS